MSNKNTNEETIRELIGPYVDDSLPAEARARVEAALMQSKELAWEVLTLRLTRETLKSGAGDVVASDAFRARVLRKLYADNPHVTKETEAETEGQFRLPMTI
jgi:anti-sigma factor RsiW